MINVAGDMWFPYSYRILVSAAVEFAMCTVAGKNLKTVSRKNDLGTLYEPKEPNERIQLYIWGRIKHLNESEKFVVVAVERFSRW